MIARNLKESDIPILQSLAVQSGFPYPDLNKSTKLETALVIAGQEDNPIVTVLAERLVQLYMISDPEYAPYIRLQALRLAHTIMARRLKALGYDSAEAFVPPEMAKRFGRRLMRTFGWTPNWPSFNHRT